MNPEIIFVTGKGGVGKSTVAAALALKKAKNGHRTLLVEIGDQSFYKDYLNLKNVDFTPTPVRENFSVSLWTGQNCLREYIIHHIKVEALYKLFFENSVMKAFINVAPALPELAIMGKATSGPRHHGPELPFDCIIMDCFATGHFLALMAAPAGMAQVVKFGPMGEQSQNIDKVLRDPRICQYNLVCLPEELPVRETEELYEQLSKVYGIKANIILNKCFEETIPESDFKAAEKSSSAEFLNFAHEQKSIQSLHSEMKKRLEQISGRLQVLPPVWDHDVNRILDQLAARLL